MEIYIYSISCPLTSEIKYIGKTINFKRRIYQHTCRSGRMKNSKLSNWIDKLYRMTSRRPKFNIIEVYLGDSWQDREMYWIEFYSKNNNLCNLTKGGEGGHGRPMGEDLKRKISEAHKGKKKNYKCMGGVQKHSEYSKNKMSQKMMGNSSARGSIRSVSFIDNIKNKLTHKIILNIESGIFHIGLEDACKSYDLKKSTLSNYLSNRRRNKTNLILT